MLQRTPVRRVEPRFAAFIARFPDPRSCAAAPVGDAVRLWDGLGYNRRAVQLHRAATAIVTDHAGEVPADLDDLLALPGVGPYTARAVASFAFGRRFGVVDTNAGRVLARAVAGRPLAARAAQALADDLVPPGRSAAWNQAMMDLGAEVCRPRPRCDVCPVRAGCTWQMAGGGSPDPAVGSAGVSAGQSRFVGSDREGRGRLVAALRLATVASADAAAAMGWEDDPVRADRVLTGLVAEGLVRVVDGEIRLP